MARRLSLPGGKILKNLPHTQKKMPNIPIKNAIDGIDKLITPFVYKKNN